MKDRVLRVAESFLRFMLLVANQQQFQDTRVAIHGDLFIVPSSTHKIPGTFVKSGAGSDTSVAARAVLAPLTWKPKAPR